MSRSATRARRRRTRIEGQIEALLGRMASATTATDWFAANDELVRLLKRVADSNLRLWGFEAQLIGGSRGEDADATRALLAQLVAPNLAGRSVPRREEVSNRRSQVRGMRSDTQTGGTP